MTKKRTDVGYGKPPTEHRFKKGQSGNPGGRPKKARPEPRSNDLKSIVRRAVEKKVVVNDEELTLLEVGVMQLMSKVVKGDMSAIRELNKLLKELGIDEPPARAGGVLVVPAPMDFDQWGKAAYAQQAKFREKDPEGR